MLALLLLPARAGIETLRAGGNAVDAAVACALMLGVVAGFNSGLGGGCFLTIRLADGRVVAIDGRETAPAAAAREMFVREGRAVPALSQFGALAPVCRANFQRTRMPAQTSAGCRWPAARGRGARGGGGLPAHTPTPAG